MPNIATTSRGSADKPLTDRQRRFVEEYMVDLNATAAAVRAGYSPRSSGLYTTTMGLPHVKAAVERALEEKREASEINSHQVLQALGAIAFSNIFDYLGEDGGGRLTFDLAAARRDKGCAIAAVSIDYHPTKTAGAGQDVRRVSVRLADKNAALRELSRHLGMLYETIAEAGEPEYKYRDLPVCTGVASPGDPTGKLGFYWRVPTAKLPPESRHKGFGANEGDPRRLMPHQIAYERRKAAEAAARLAAPQAVVNSAAD